MEKGAYEGSRHPHHHVVAGCPLRFGSRRMNIITKEELLLKMGYPRKIAHTIAEVPSEWIIGYYRHDKETIDELTLEGLTGLTTYKEYWAEPSGGWKGGD